MRTNIYEKKDNKKHIRKKKTRNNKTEKKKNKYNKYDCKTVVSERFSVNRYHAYRP